VEEVVAMTITRAEALMWLNDRIGEHAGLSLLIYSHDERREGAERVIANVENRVLNLHGTLRHVQVESEVIRGPLDGARDNPPGMYFLDDARIDLTEDALPCQYDLGAEGELEIQLADGQTVISIECPSFEEILAKGGNE
jgi:hypothetical protein